MEYSSIDWHDFVVVETINFRENETGQLVLLTFCSLLVHDFVYSSNFVASYLPESVELMETIVLNLILWSYTRTHARTHAQTHFCPIATKSIFDQKHLLHTHYKWQAKDRKVILLVLHYHNIVVIALVVWLKG